MSTTMGPLDNYWLEDEEMVAMGHENQGDMDARLHHIRMAFRDAQRRRIEELDNGIHIIAVQKFPERDDIKGRVLCYASPAEVMGATAGRIK